MASKSSKKEDQQTQEKIVSKFHQLRSEQRNIATKLTELEDEKNEHRLVIETLKKVDPGRRCFRMVGGVLVERTVKDILPALEHNFEQMTVLIKKLMEQLTEKGKEVNAFREKHGIKIVDDRENKDSKSSDSTSSSAVGVLVS